MPVRLLAAFQSLMLENDLVDAAGKTIAKAGDTILLMPQTLASAVIFGDGANLAEKLVLASQTASGLLSAADKKKLDGIAAGAQVNPGGATQTANGLMSAADKKKLDGIAAGATNTAAPPAAGTAAPKAHGTASAGTSANYAREDHVHPSNNTDTHWTSHLYVGASNGNVNAATANGATYLILCDNSTARDRRLIKGAGAVTVTSDASGNITITGTNTTYGAASQTATGLMSAADKKKLDGIAAGAQVNNTNVIPLTGSRGTPAGNETAQALSNSQTIASTAADCINLATSGAVALTFTPAAATVRAVKVICLTASAATTLVVKNAVWANKGSAPAWGSAGKVLVLLAHFVGGRVVLSVVDNTQ